MGVFGIGRRALRWMIIFCLIFTLLATSVLFRLSYDQTNKSIEEQIDQILQAQTLALETSLWSFDKEQLSALIQGMLFYPFINYVEVTNLDKEVSSAGTKKAQSAGTDLVLTYNYDNKQITVGSVYLQTDTEKVLISVVDKVFWSLILQAAWLFFQSFFIFLLFERMITRHLVTIALYLKGFDPDLVNAELHINKSYFADELDILVTTFNGMQRNLSVTRNKEKVAQDELRQSEARYRSLIEEAPDGIIVFNPHNGKVIDGNRKAEEIFGRTRQELFQLGIGDLIEVNAPTSNFLAIPLGQATVTLHTVRTAQGQELTCELRLTRIASEEQDLVRASFLDITDRVKAEKEILNTLEQKEVLIQEVYHRTKNNMQVIAGLLEMQAMCQEDEMVKAVLKEMVCRIKSMALVHEKLYESKDLSSICLRDYLVELTNWLRDSLQYEKKNIHIEISVNTDLSVPLEIAIPCGLILNELLLNAFKYAFPDGRQGLVRISVEEKEVQKLTLTVADDGIGLPTGFDLQKHGHMGVKTVFALAEDQLKGSFSYLPGQGTQGQAEFTIGK